MKRSLSLFCSLFLLLGLQIVLPAQNVTKLRKNMESVLVDAVQLYDSGNYKDARARLSVIVDSDPSNDAAYYYLGLCDYYLGNVKDAEVELREAMKLDPKNYWYRDRLAVLYSMTGQEELTINMYESLLEDYPKKTDIYYNLVNLYAHQGRMEKVIETLDNIETIVGKDETTTIARYDVLMHMGRNEDAFKVLEAFNEEYSSPQILSLMGDVKINEYNDSLALKYYDEALALDSELPSAIIGKSEVYRIRRSYDEYFDILSGFTSSPSIPVQMKSQYLTTLVQHLDGRFVQNFRPQLDSLFESGIKAHPADSSMLLAAGTYYFRSERQPRAVQLFKRNSELFPDNFNAVAMYVQSLSYGDDWDTLAEESEKAFSAFPQEAAFLNMRLMAFYNKNDYESVIKESERMVSLFPKDTTVALQAYSSIGDCHHLLGNEKLAFQAYEKALKINPAYAPVLNNYAYYLSLKGKKLKKAYAMSKITVEQEPDNATYLDTFAWILHLQGKSLEAKSFFKHAMLYGGKESVTMLDHYAEVLYALKEYDLAGVYWNMAKQKNADNEVPDLEERIEVRMKAVKK